MLFLCSCSHKENTESIIDIDKTATEITTVETTESTVVEKTSVISESNDENNQIFNALECVCNQIMNGYDKEPYDIFNGTEHITYDNEIAFFMANVSQVENSTLGEITGEEDLIEKSREVFIERLGQDFIESVEADYTIKNGVKLAIVERRTPVYYVEYCDEVDIWYIYPCMPVGKLEDGSDFCPIYEWGAFLMIRGSDGEIVGCRF
jgi:hypothetical protein